MPDSHRANPKARESQTIPTSQRDKPPVYLGYPTHDSELNSLTHSRAPQNRIAHAP